MKRIVVSSILIAIVVSVIFISTVTAKTNYEIQITEEMAYKGVNNYCHKNYDWSIADDNPYIMYTYMGEELDNEYQIIFRSYTGSFVNFYVNKINGMTRMVENVPNLDVKNDIGTININDYLSYYNLV